jgi:hypothetical protein
MTMEKNARGMMIVSPAAVLALAAAFALLLPPVVAVAQGNPFNQPAQETPVRDLDGVARGDRYIENQSFTYPTGVFSVNGTITPAIPAGKKLLLKRASVHSILTDDQSPMEVRLSISGVGAIGYVPQVLQAISSTVGQRHFTGDADLDVVVTEGESLLVFLFRNNNLGTQSLNFSRIVLTGHLVDDL